MDLTKTLVWPAALLLLIARFENPLLSIFDRLSKITLKTGETEATLEIEKKATTVGALVGAATAVSVQPIRDLPLRPRLGFLWRAQFWNPYRSRAVSSVKIRPENSLDATYSGWTTDRRITDFSSRRFANFG